jgi:large repetitive protein
MSMTMLRSYRKTGGNETRNAAIASYPCQMQWSSQLGSVLMLLAAFVLAGISGCSTGGYPGGGITSLTASSVTIDAAQSFSVTANMSGNLNVTWNLSGVSCTGDACGTLSAQNGTKVTYTAPSGVTSQMQVTLTAEVVNTSNSKTVTITVNPAPTIAGTLPLGSVGTTYSAKLTAQGGTGTLAMSMAGGSLPPGLTFDAATGAISGTPTASGTYNFTVQVVDQSSIPYTATQAESITVTSTAVTPLSLTMSTLPNGTVGVPYSATIGVTGGTAPYSCTIAAGSLPAGLMLGGGCVVSGTPMAAGTSTVTVTATDSSNPALTTTGPETITITNNTTPLSLTMSTLPNGTVNVPYSATIGVSGGTAPYSCTITSGTLPTGLSLGAGCVVSGTPTVAGTSTVTVNVTDSSNPAQTTSGPETITIAPAALSLTMSTLPDGTVGVPYSATIGVSGGTSPYTCTVTSGSLPAGLSITGCTVSGKPTTAGTSTVTVKVTDSGNPVQTTSGPETITINAAGSSLTVSTLPDGTVGVPYSATVGVTGGASPYTCTISGLPAGLSSSNCTVTGTPTTAGSFTVTVKATDSSNPMQTKTVTQTITISGSGTLSLTGTLPDATVNVAYSQSLTATGGTAPYTYAITKGNLPAGINLSTDTSVNTNGSALFSGTPTQVGASSFTLTVTDAAHNTASLNLVLLVKYPSSPNDSELDGPYVFLFQGYDDVVSGVLAYKTATVGSFTADGMGGISAGEEDANHQSSTPVVGTTVETGYFLGTYIVNSDNRGFITITTINDDGTTGQTTTYAISLAAPASPSAASTQGDLIEYDNDQLTGTRGSGSLLAQTPSAITTGLSGSYAFGLTGDTPCLAACSLNLNLFGPVASVGEFAASGGTLSGNSDANVASTNYPNAQLDGYYQPADANGRVQVALTNGSNPAGAYPSDYAVYIVNSDEVFMMSTDAHSAYILQAGTAQLQTTPSAFSSASLNGALVGYENNLPNPGLVSGTVLSGVLNLSSATIFRATCDGTSQCDTTNVDNAGLTSFLNGITGGVLNLLGGHDAVVEDLLGAYTTTGNSNYSTISSYGRGVLNYPESSLGLLQTIIDDLGLESILPNGTPAPRVFYLYGPNEGYFLETGYAGLGQFEAQTGTPYSLGSLSGTYVEGTTAVASLASIDTSGYFTSDGNGKVTNYTLDENVGVGNINILQLGTTGSTTYTQVPNNTTTGRYVLGDGTTVLYAISPNRFVMLNTNPLETAPSISLLFK